MTRDELAAMLDDVLKIIIAEKLHKEPLLPKIVTDYENILAKFMYADQSGTLSAYLETAVYSLHKRVVSIYGYPKGIEDDDDDDVFFVDLAKYEDYLNSFSDDSDEQGEYEPAENRISIDTALLAIQYASELPYDSVSEMLENAGKILKFVRNNTSSDC